MSTAANWRNRNGEITRRKRRGESDAKHARRVAELDRQKAKFATSAKKRKATLGSPEAAPDLDLEAGCRSSTDCREISPAAPRVGAEANQVVGFAERVEAMREHRRAHLQWAQRHRFGDGSDGSQCGSVAAQTVPRQRLEIIDTDFVATDQEDFTLTNHTELRVMIDGCIDTTGETYVAERFSTLSSIVEVGVIAGDFSSATGIIFDAQKNAFINDGCVYLNSVISLNNINKTDHGRTDLCISPPPLRGGERETQAPKPAGQNCDKKTKDQIATNFWSESSPLQAPMFAVEILGSATERMIVADSPMPHQGGAGGPSCAAWPFWPQPPSGGGAEASVAVSVPPKPTLLRIAAAEMIFVHAWLVRRRAASPGVPLLLRFGSPEQAMVRAVLAECEAVAGSSDPAMTANDPALCRFVSLLEYALDHATGESVEDVAGGMVRAPREEVAFRTGFDFLAVDGVEHRFTNFVVPEMASQKFAIVAED